MIYIDNQEGQRKVNPEKKPLTLVMDDEDDIKRDLSHLRKEVSELRLWLAFVCGIVAVVAGIMGASVALWR